jgi:phosphomannomutase
MEEWFTRLPGNIGIGNVRYTTSGKCDEQSIIAGTQPVQAGIDGIKLIDDDGWVLMRPRNTEPIIRVSAEAKTEKKLGKLYARRKNGLPQLRGSYFARSSGRDTSWTGSGP